jgi:hypothetical protein
MRRTDLRRAQSTAGIRKAETPAPVEQSADVNDTADDGHVPATHGGGARNLSRI